MHYAAYAEVPEAELEALVDRTELGRLVTVGEGGLPHIGLYPFVVERGAVGVHLHRKDEQLADLERSPRCLFELDEVLATIPSHWIDPDDAVMATAYHRTVVFECRARVVRDPSALAAHQARFMQRYQPEGGYRALAPDEPLYREALGTIAAVRLEIEARRIKWKLGQNRSPEVRAVVVERLRARGRAGDRRAADALQWTIDRDRERSLPAPSAR